MGLGPEGICPSWSWTFRRCRQSGFSVLLMALHSLTYLKGVPPMRSIHFKLISFLALLGILYWLTNAAASDHPSATSLGPRQSSPIALTVDDSKLVNVNPEANTISVFDTSSSMLVKLGEVKVGRDPESVAIQPNVGGDSDDDGEQASVDGHSDNDDGDDD